MEKQLKNLKKRRSSDEQLVEGRIERMELDASNGRVKLAYIGILATIHGRET